MADYDGFVSLQNVQDQGKCHIRVEEPVEGMGCGVSGLVDYSCVYNVRESMVRLH